MVMRQAVHNDLHRHGMFEVEPQVGEAWNKAFLHEEEQLEWMNGRSISY